MPERFAIYYAPEANHPLWRQAAEWIGRDPLTGETHDGPLPGIDRAALTPFTVSARRYGFHATIKAPMALAEGISRGDLEDALAAYAETAVPVEIGALSLRVIGGGFLALIPAVQSEALTDFAAEVVDSFDPFRARLSAIERARRLEGASFTERQVALLDQYGYPYVFEQFQFHMTLTDRLPEGQREAIRSAAAAFFGPLAEAELTLERLVLFHEPEPGAPFARVGDFVLNGEAANDRIRVR